ncbi:MAG TPA: hypothetical protein DCM68_00650 [Verrucomicrobia bacterium]|nr:hypothetical protein [Verrucomicrobiota bacterium]
MAKMADFDSSGFQNIVLMLIGVLVIMLVSNILTIISNPENIKIGALVTGAVYEEETGTFIPPKFQNMRQDPIYIDVEPTRLIIYPERTVVEARDLMFEGNEFEKFLDQAEQIKDVRYVILLLRPGSAVFQRKLRQVIRERGIDVGFEPWEAGREIMVVGAPPPPPAEGAPAGEAAPAPVGEAAAEAPAGGEGT